MSEHLPVLDVEELTVVLRSGAPIIERVSLRLERGRILGIVGESGSGKSTLALGVLGHTRPGCRIDGGMATISGTPVLALRPRELRRLRARLVSYVPQNPGSSLNPARRVGDQIADRLLDLPRNARVGLVRSALEEAQLPNSPEFLRRFPYQLSGGQQQRVAIAMALVARPELIVLDEPTTGLDVVTQASLLAEIRRLRDEFGATLVYVSHDIAAVASVADDVAVMYAGRIVEHGPFGQVLRRPLHPYTVGLIESVPDPTRRVSLRGLPGLAPGVGEWPAGCAFAPRCPLRMDVCTQESPTLDEVAPERAVRCFAWDRTPALQRDVVARPVPGARRDVVLSVDGLRATHRSRREEVVAADAVSFTVHAGECVAIVGESGSGKTTIARCLVGLHAPAKGSVRLLGEELQAQARRRSRDARRHVQIVFQSPHDSLNPRHRVGASVGRPARQLIGLSAREADAEMRQALERVRLSSRIADRYPRELSGGECQRVALARALVARPRVIVCDEITSALDVSVQGAVLDLLGELRREIGLALVFITHDLGVVASIADRVLVLDRGTICESGTVDDVLGSPTHSYTRQLVGAAPQLAVVA